MGHATTLYCFGLPRPPMMKGIALMSLGMDKTKAGYVVYITIACTQAMPSSRLPINSMSAIRRRMPKLYMPRTPFLRSSLLLLFLFYFVTFSRLLAPNGGSLGRCARHNKRIRVTEDLLAGAMWVRSGATNPRRGRPREPEEPGLHVRRRKPLPPSGSSGLGDSRRQSQIG